MNPTVNMDATEVNDANNEITQSSIQDLSSSSSSSEDSGDGRHDQESENRDETIAQSNARNSNSSSPNARKSKRMSTNKQLSYFLGFKDRSPPPKSELAFQSAIQSNESADGADVKSITSDISPENSPVPPPVIELTMEPESSREHFNRTVIAGRQNFGDTSHPEGDDVVITGASALDSVRFESGSTQTFTRSQLVHESSDELRTILRESLGKPTALTCGYANSQAGNPVNPLRITAVAMLSEATDLIVAITITAKPGCKLVANSYGIKRVAVFSQSGKQVLMEKYFDIVVSHIEDDVSGSKAVVRRAEVVESKGCCYSRPKVPKLPASATTVAEKNMGQDGNDAAIIAPNIDTEPVDIEDNVPRELNFGSASGSGKSIDALTVPAPVDIVSLSTPVDIVSLSTPVDIVSLSTPVDIVSLSTPVDMASLPTPIDTTPAPVSVDTTPLSMQIDATPAPISVEVAPPSPPADIVSMTKSVDATPVMKPIEVIPVPLLVPIPTPPLPVIKEPVLKSIEAVPVSVLEPSVTVADSRPVIIDEVPESVAETPKKKTVSNSSAPSPQVLPAVRPKEEFTKKKEDDFHALAKKSSKPLVTGNTDCCGNPKVDDDCCAPAKNDTKADVVSVAGRGGSPSEEKSGPVGSDECCPLNDVDEGDNHECCPSGAATKKMAAPAVASGNDCCGNKKKEDDCCAPKKKAGAAVNSSGATVKNKASAPVVGSENERKGFCFGKPTPVPVKKDAPSEMVKKTTPPAAQTGLQYDGCRNTGFCVFVPYCVWPWEAKTYKPTTLPRSSPNYRPLAKNRI